MFPYSHAEGSNYNQDKINCISIESKSLSQDYVHHETIENDYIYSVPQILHILKRESGGNSHNTNATNPFYLILIKIVLIKGTVANTRVILSQL